MSINGKEFVEDSFSTAQNLIAMLESDNKLYEKCIGTENFAFHFNQIANKAIRYDRQITEIARLQAEITKLNQENGKMLTMIEGARRALRP